MEDLKEFFNGLDELIVLHKRYDSVINEHNGLAQKTRVLNNHKRALQPYLDEIEGKPHPIDPFWDELIENAKKISNEISSWVLFTTNYERLNKISEDLEIKIGSKQQNKFTDSQIVKIEVLISEYERLIPKMEDNVKNRTKLFYDGERIFDEILRILGLKN